LITSVKRPRVKIVAGRVRMKRMGLINVLTRPSTTETMIAVIKLLTVTPGSTCAVIYTARPFMSRLTSISIGTMVNQFNSKVNKGALKKLG